MTRAARLRSGASLDESSTTSSTTDRSRFDVVVAAFAEAQDVSVRPGWGAGNLVVLVGKKMFALFTSVGFVAKLPRSRVDELVTAGMGTRFDPRRNGQVMKEWVVVDSRGDWRSLVREAHKFVRGGGK